MWTIFLNDSGSGVVRWAMKFSSVIACSDHSRRLRFSLSWSIYSVTPKGDLLNKVGHKAWNCLIRLHLPAWDAVASSFWAKIFHIVWASVRCPIYSLIEIWHAVLIMAAAFAIRLFQVWTSVLSPPSGYYPSLSIPIRRAFQLQGWAPCPVSSEGSLTMSTSGFRSTYI